MANQDTGHASSKLRSYGSGLSVLSAAFAGAMIAAPRRVARLLSLPTRPRLIRWLAARDLVIGATLLNGALRRRGLAMRGMADAADAALILARRAARKSVGRNSAVKAAISLATAASALGLALRADDAREAR